MFSSLESSPERGPLSYSQSSLTIFNSYSRAVTFNVFAQRRSSAPSVNVFNAPNQMVLPSQVLALTTSKVRCILAIGYTLSDELRSIALETDCTNAGYPVSGVSTGGSTSGSTTGSGLSGTGLGSGTSATATAAAATATGGLGLGGTTTAAGSAPTTTSSSGSGSGITFGKSSATGLTAQLGVVAAAVAGVIILAA